MNRVNLLEIFDIYSSLLTNKEQEIFKLYYEEDLSLSEISENLSITRSAVSKTLKTVENKLLTFEEKLQKQEIKKELETILKEDNLENIKKRITKIIDL